MTTTGKLTIDLDGRVIEATLGNGVADVTREEILLAAECAAEILLAARCRRLACRHVFVLTAVADLPEGALSRIQTECPVCGHKGVVTEDEATWALTCPACGFTEAEPGDTIEEAPH